MQVLNDYTQEETAELLIKHCKYTEYVSYIINNSKSIRGLYKLFDEKVEEAKYINREHIADVYHTFYMKTSDEKIYNQCCYYSFLYDKDESHLRYLDMENKNAQK